MYIKADDYSLNDLLHIIKIWANPGLFFVYFRPFINPPSIIIYGKSVDGVLGIQTWSHRMVGADQTKPRRYGSHPTICIMLLLFQF